MKKILPTLAGLMMAGMGVFAAGEARAVPGSVTTYVFYSGTQIVGQAILYCDNRTQHWGYAPSTGLSDAVAVAYSCASGNAIRVSYPTSLDPSIPSIFCKQSNACVIGPQPVPGAGPTSPGLYSD